MTEQIEFKRIAVIFAAMAIILMLPLAMYPGSNVYCRMAMTFQIVDQGVIHIDPWLHKTNDFAKGETHAYNDKAPGSALIAVPAYTLFKTIWQRTSDHMNYNAARHFIRVITLLPLCLFTAFFAMGFLARRDLDALWFGPAWLFGTVAFPFSVLLFGHQYAACFIALSFFSLYRYKTDPAQQNSFALPLLAGLLCGLAILTEYPAALLALLLGIYMLTFERRMLTRVVPFGLVGVGLPAVGIGLFNWAAFGSPLAFGYQQLDDAHNLAGMSDGILGVSFPTMAHLWEITFSPAGGLFFSAPWLLFAPIGMVALIVQKGKRAEGILFLVSMIAYLAFNAGYWEPGGAMSFGPRHLTPVVPFMALAAFIGGQVLGRIVKGIFYGTVVFSILFTAFGTFSDPTMPDRLTNPVFDFAFPILARGFGLESPLGLRGPALLGVFCCIMALTWLIVRARRQTDEEKRHLFPLGWTFRTLAALFVLYLLVLPYVGRSEPGLANQVMGNYFFKRSEYNLAEEYYRLASQTRSDAAIHYYRMLSLGHLGRTLEMKWESEKAMQMHADPDFQKQVMQALELYGRR